MAIDDDDRGVGYRRPPRANRFRVGHSGNPSGRPKRSPTLRSDLALELAETVSVEEGGRLREFSKQRAILKAIVAAAVGGDIRAAAMVMDLSARILGAGPSDASDSNADDGNDDQVLEDFLARETSRRAKPSTDQK